MTIRDTKQLGAALQREPLGILPTGKYESDDGPGVEDCLDLLKSSEARRLFP